MLVKALDKDRKRNTVFSLSLQNGGKAEEVTAMIRDVQIDPMSRQPVHVDFIRVSLDEAVKVTIPVVLLGIPLESPMAATCTRAIAIFRSQPSRRTFRPRSRWM